jgi:hypothetical protein
VRRTLNQRRETRARGWGRVSVPTGELARS